MAYTYSSAEYSELENSEVGHSDRVDGSSADVAEGSALHFSEGKEEGVLGSAGVAALGSSEGQSEDMPGLMGVASLPSSEGQEEDMSGLAEGAALQSEGQEEDMPCSAGDAALMQPSRGQEELGTPALTGGATTLQPSEGLQEEGALVSSTGALQDSECRPETEGVLLPTAPPNDADVTEGRRDEEVDSEPSNNPWEESVDGAVKVPETETESQRGATLAMLQEGGAECEPLRTDATQFSRAKSALDSWPAEVATVVMRSTSPSMPAVVVEDSEESAVGERAAKGEVDPLQPSLSPVRRASSGKSAWCPNEVKENGGWWVTRRWARKARRQ